MIDFQQMVRERLRGIGLSPVREAEIVDEVAQHLRDRYESHMSNGASPQEAERQIAAELNERVLARELRDIERRWSEPVTLGAERPDFWSGLWQDVRYGARVLRMNPAFTAVCVLSLALGIGANTAIFQLIDAVRMRTLPVKNPQELAIVRIKDRHWNSGEFHGPFSDLTNPMWQAIRERQQGFSGIFAWGGNTLNLNTGGQTQYARGMWVSGDFFNVLGITPILGRVFTDADDVKGCASPGAVISYSFWQRYYGGDASVVGKKLTLDGHPFEVIGVT